MRHSVSLLAALLFLSACDSGTETGPVQTAPEAPLVVHADLAGFPGDPAGDRAFGVSLVADGTTRDSYFGQDGPTGLFSSFFSGLWLTGTQSGATKAAVSWYGDGTGQDNLYSNFRMDCPGGNSGLFALDADTSYTSTQAWPRALGAPVDAQGAPMVYGDKMLWGSFCSSAIPGEPYFQVPFDGLRVNIAVYGYERADIREARFVRFDVTNTSDAPISDLRTGYFSDTDTPVAIIDAVGFDEGTGLSYVYSKGGYTNGQTSTRVTGFAFLDTPQSAPLQAHRIMRKNNYYNPEFGETGVETPEQLVFALRGLGNDGEPMIDPTTGAASLFAFTGDGLAGTGWVDGRFGDNGEYQGVDIRHMTSVQPVTLAPGESMTFTVVWVSAQESSTAASLADVRRLMSVVRGERSLWDVDAAM